MLKFLIITFLLGYLFFKLIGMLFKLVLKSTSAANHEHFRSHQSANNHRAPSDGNVNIDYVPKKGEKSKKDFKGGDYVDYEEVK